MQSLQSRDVRLLRLCYRYASLTYRRDASLTSAISRGIRKGANSLDRIGTSRNESVKDEREQRRSTTPPRSRFELERLTQPNRQQVWRQKRWEREKEARNRVSHEAPAGIPYTTAGSEFLYGTFSVKSALEAKRRQLHKLYIWKGERSAGDELDGTIYKLARSQRIQIQEVAGTWDKTLMRMSNQRPHNGYVLEASPVPKLPVTKLEKMERHDSSLVVNTASQSAEDQVANSTFGIDGFRATIQRNGNTGRFPLLLWLDRVTDTGNLGAIIRTAYFLGVDAIIIPEHGTAPLSAVTLKASAGAAEWLPIMTVKKEVDFIRRSQEDGWKFFAAAAPESASTRYRSSQSQTDSTSDALNQGPCILMVGNEGEGLRHFLQKAADESISIRGVHGMSRVVDSLNVSVAAALLTARFFAASDQSEPSTMPYVGSSETSEPSDTIF